MIMRGLTTECLHTTGYSTGGAWARTQRARGGWGRAGRRDRDWELGDGNLHTRVCACAACSSAGDLWAGAQAPPGVRALVGPLSAFILYATAVRVSIIYIAIWFCLTLCL